jgi:hypothetical protein
VGKVRAEICSSSSGEKGEEEVSTVSYVEILEESFGTELEVFDLSGW